MLKDTIKDYFLDKPGTFDEQENSCVSLSLASKKICEIHSDYVEIKLEKGLSQEIRKKLHAKAINSDGNFEWNVIDINEVSFNDLCELLDESYESTIDTLPDDERREIFDLEW